MFHNILACIDGSEHAERALREALDLATTQRSRLTLLTAVSRPPYWANTPLTAAGIEPLAGDLQKEAEKTLRAAVDQVPASVPVTTILTEDPIREALICQIKTGKYDLVVMGSRGRGALSASLLGSVSHYALNHSDVPVLIVRAEENGEDVADGERAVVVEVNRAEDVGTTPAALSQAEQVENPTPRSARPRSSSRHQRSDPDREGGPVVRAIDGESDRRPRPAIA